MNLREWVGSGATGTDRALLERIEHDVSLLEQL